MEYPKKLAYLTSLLTASKDDSVGDLIHLVLAERDRIKNVLKEKLCDISKYVQL